MEVIMSEPVKFTEEEMSGVKDIQKQFFDIQRQFGQIAMARLRLQEQLDNLDQSESDLVDQFNKNKEKENKFLDETTKKYGEGSLNPETGEFTPNK
jgi:hypothetical protein|tara:strand:- start:64 stop:351 length:288 start_codon:yes stop_codon:yes gene_type:complete